MTDISDVTYRHVISAKEGHRAVDSGGAMVVDVRPKSSQARDGVVARGIGTDREDIPAHFAEGSPQRHPELETKDRPVILVCGSLAGFEPVLQQLTALGYTHVYQVEGGYRAWTLEHGARVERGQAGECLTA